MKMRKALKILRSGKKYRLSTLRQACMKLNKYAPKWAQPLKISGVVCRCWADSMVVAHKQIHKI